MLCLRNKNVATKTIFIAVMFVVLVVLIFTHGGYVLAQPSYRAAQEEGTPQQPTTGTQNQVEQQLGGEQWYQDWQQQNIKTDAEEQAQYEADSYEYSSGDSNSQSAQPSYRAAQEEGSSHQPAQPSYRAAQDVGITGGGGAGTDYKLLAPIGRELTQVDTTDVPGYLQKIFQIVLGLASVLAVLMIVVGGIRYMVSEAVGEKEGAKKQITAAILGLLLAFSSVLILNTINPDLLKLELPKLLLPAPVPSRATPPPTAPPSAVLPPSPVTSAPGAAEAGSGAQQYQWVTIPFGKFCRDVLGAGWVGVDPRWCSGNQPNPLSSCCGFFPSQAPAQPETPDRVGYSEHIETIEKVTEDGRILSPNVLREEIEFVISNCEGQGGEATKTYEDDSVVEYACRIPTQ